jgi:hypothetical protein
LGSSGTKLSVNREFNVLRRCWQRPPALGHRHLLLYHWLDNRTILSVSTVQMAHDDTAKDYLAQHLERPLGHSEYTEVQALIIYWQESDKLEAYEEEAGKLQELFRVLQYDTEVYKIPVQDSQLNLSEVILRHCNRLSGQLRGSEHDPSSLLIIHYGGHGDKDDDKHATDGRQERRAVWRA